MTELLYLTDARRREFDAVVVEVRPEGLRLDRTAFYAAGGGQPSDRGELVAADGRRWAVTNVDKGSGEATHAVTGGEPPSPGTAVHGRLDWTLRYAHMRYHTLLHVLSGVVYKRFGAGTKGGQISATGARMDFAMPELTRALSEELVAEVRTVVTRDLPVEVRFVPRSELARDPSLVRVSEGLLPDVDPVRLIDIVGHDVQADGGTHVRSTREIGEVALERLENKGARNKRLYLAVGPAVDGRE